MRFAVRIDVSHLPGVLDPQGATVERALPALGYHNVSEISIAKTIRLIVDAPSASAAEAQVDEMCRRLLANPVIEHYAIALEELVDQSNETKRSRARRAGQRSGVDQSKGRS